MHLDDDWLMLGALVNQLMAQEAAADSARPLVPQIARHQEGCSTHEFAMLACTKLTWRMGMGRARVWRVRLRCICCFYLCACLQLASIQLSGPGFCSIMLMGSSRL